MDPEYPPCMAEVDLTPSRVIARRIRAARKSRGLTQDQVEEKTGVPQTTLSQWENGVGFLTLDTAAKVLAKIGADPTLLIGDDPPAGDAEAAERELLRVFRSLSEKDRPLVLEMIKLQAAHRAP